MAEPACKSWTLDATNQSLCVCYLQATVDDPSKGHAAAGCLSGVPPPPPPPPPALTVTAEPYFSQNQTLAAFLIARGASAMLELPVCGAFEAMSDYDLTNPLLDVDFGHALGAGERVAPGRFRREYAKATVELDCKGWSSTFTLKDG